MRQKKLMFKMADNGKQRSSAHLKKGLIFTTQAIVSDRRESELLMRFYPEYNHLHFTTAAENKHCFHP
jgi:hypothetical protein